MNSVIELHDSELLSIDNERGVLAVEAWMHRSNGEPFAAGSEGGTQLVHFHFADMAMNGDLIDLPADIYDGNLKTTATKLNNIIPLPCSCNEPVTLEIYLTDLPLTFSGSSLSIEVIGEFKFVEYWHG